MKSIINFGIRQYAALNLKRWDETVNHPERFQQAIFEDLLHLAKDTEFGKEHGFDQIKSYEEYCKAVPLRTYEDFLPYVDKILEGNDNVLFPGRPKYFAKSSGTTSNIKFLPVYDTFSKTYSRGGMNILFSYMRETKNYDIVMGTNLLIQGSPLLDDINGFKLGRMSGISHYLMPQLIKRKQLPSYETNIIADWEDKVNQIVEESIGSDLRIIGGLPPWISMYFDRLSDKTQKTLISDIFPNLQLYIHGGVNIEPYRQLLNDKIGKQIHTLDTYTASEGFFGFQESLGSTDMTLCTDSGIFYEFVALDEYRKNSVNPKRLKLTEVEANIDYVIILNTMSGLWGYVLGDTIRFTTCGPYRFIISGRVSQFTSLFSEHVIESEVRTALEAAIEEFGFSVRAFTVAPRLLSQSSQSHHEWWIEFDKTPLDIEAIQDLIDAKMCAQNHCYSDSIKGKVISPLKIIQVKPKGFERCFLEDGKIDGQNKIPVLANDRVLVERLEDFCLE